DEVPLTDVERRDAHLHLLDRFERNRRNAGASARLTLAEAERVVERRSVDLDVVQAVVLAGEGVAARLRSEPSQIADAAADRRETLDVLPRDLRRGARAARAEDRIDGGRHVDGFLN